MTTSIIGHTMKPGHRCRNPFSSQIRAENIKAGERVEYGGWELWGNWSGSGSSQYCYYRVSKARGVSDVYEFSNITCAAAKLKELGDIK